MHGFIFLLVMVIKACCGDGLVLLHHVLILFLKVPVHQLFDCLIRVTVILVFVSLMHLVAS